MVNSKISTKKGYTRSLEEAEIILDNIPGLVFYKDDKNNLIRVNKYFADAHKTTKEALAGKNCFDIYPKDVAQKYFDDDLEVIKSKKPKLNFIEPWDVAEGRRWVNTNKIPLYDDDGKCIGIIGFSTDVTAQVKAEQKLKETQNQLNSILSNLKDTVFVISEDYKILFKNENAYSVFGEDLVGRNCFEVIKGEEQVCDNCPIQNLLTNDVCQIHSEQQVHAPISNKIKIFDVITTPIEIYNGKKAYLELLRDITKRKEMEVERVRLAAIVENSDDAIIGKTLNGTILSWNKGAERIYGYTSKEIIGKHISILIPSDSLDELSGILERIKAGDRIDHFETIRVRKDGKEINISLTISPINDMDGSIIGASAIARDITERKKAEEKLRKTQEQLNTIFSSLKDTVFVISEEYKILFSNDSARDLFGEELVGNLCYEVIKRFDQPCGHCPIKSFLEKDVSKFHFEQCINTPLLEGERVFDIISSPIESYAGQPAIVEVLRDITSRKKLEKEMGEYRDHLEELVEQRNIELRESKEWLSTTLTSIGDAVIATDSKGNIRFLNPVAESLTGWKQSEAITKPVQEIFKIINEKSREEVESPVNRVMREGAIIGLANHTILISKDGKEIPIDDSGAPIKNKAGEIIGVVLVFRDITERRRAEGALREREKYDFLLEALTDGVLIIDREWRYLLINDEVARMVQMPKEKLIGNKMTDLFPGVENTVFGETYKQVMETNEPATAADEFTFPDGRKVWYEVQVFPAPEGLFIIVANITERKIAEQKLKESEANYRLITENANDIIYVLDDKFNAEYINETPLKKMLGYNSVEFIDNNKFSLPHPDDRKMVLNELIKGSEVGKGRADLRIRHKDGHYIWVEGRRKTFIDGNGEKKIVINLRNISERKAAEQKLKESEEKYKNLFEQTPMAILLVNFELVIEDCNTSAEDLFGYTKEELLGVNSLYLDNIPPETKLILTKSFSNYLKTGVPEQSEIQMYKKNGKMIWINSFPIQVKIAEKSYILVMIQDITERKKAEQKIKESEEKFRTLAEQSLMGIIIWQEGLVKYVNKATAEIADSPLETVEKWLIQDLFTKVHPEDLSLIKENMKEREGNANVELEYFFRIITTSGETRWIYLISKPMIYQGAQATFALVQDITERKKAEQKALRQTNTIKSINKVFEKALTTETEEELGYTCLKVAQELSGAKFGFFGEVNKEGKFDTIAISNPGWDECKMPDSEATKIIKGMEIRGMQFLPLKDGKSRIFNDPSNHPDSVSTPDGHPKITSLLAVPFKYKGKIIGQIGLGNNPEGFNHQDQEAIETLSVAMIEALMKKRVEENIKKSEENLRVSNESLKKAMEELKRSNTELEQFAYVASHDLQEPLRMVASFTQLLQNRYQDKLDDDANDFINYAVDGAIRMQSLISDLLIFSRVGTRGKPFKATDMNAVLEAIINVFRQSIKETNTKITYDPLPVIIADETQMIQLLQNLISNAIKFRSEETPSIHISGEVKADKWIFSVIDNGIGMESKYFDRIFVIFQRLHKNNEYGGTGIGLAVCKKIIQRHNGKIWVESELGKGSTFYFSIPKKNNHILKDKR